jgi:uncharacterized protein (DUF2062 family)
VKPTTPGLPLGLAIAGAVLTYLLEVGLVASGRATLVPPPTFPISLVVIAAVVVALGWPIRQTLRGTRTERLDPFRAMRVVLLAKASALVGALLGGASLGAIGHLLSRPVAPSGSDIGLTVFSIVASLAALAAGLIVEQWCRIPPDSPDDRTLSDLRGE